MNFIIDLSSSLNEGIAFNSILIIIDRFTKYAKYITVNKIITAKKLTVMFKKLSRDPKGRQTVKDLQNKEDL